MADKTIELLWGGVRFGKRLRACNIMWVSLNMLTTPALWIVEIDICKATAISTVELYYLWCHHYSR